LKGSCPGKEGAGIVVADAAADEVLKQDPAEEVRLGRGERIDLDEPVEVDPSPLQDIIRDTAARFVGLNARNTPPGDAAGAAA
jgi:hypothetical protein